MPQCLLRHQRRSGDPRHPVNTKVMGELSAFLASLHDLSVQVSSRKGDAILGEDFVNARDGRIEAIKAGSPTLVETQVRLMVEALRRRLGVLQQEQQKLLEMRQKSRRLSPQSEPTILKLLAATMRQCRKVEQELVARELELSRSRWVPEIAERRS